MNVRQATQPARQNAATDVLLVGPPLDAVGGMAEVVRLSLSLNFRDRYRLGSFATSVSTGAHENALYRIRRHTAHALTFRRHLRATSPAIVHFHTCSGFSFFRTLLDQRIARRCGCRTILHIHGGRFANFLSELGPVRRRIAIEGLRRADRVVVLSNHWRRRILEFAPTADIVAIENGIEIPPRILAPSHEGACRFLLLGSLDRIKGINDLIDACARLRQRGLPFHVTLVGPPGDAGDRTILNRKLDERGLTGDIRYLGTVVGDAKHDLLRECDVYLQPSHYEGMPLGVLEAMSFARPVIATTVGALPEMITHEQEGLLVPPHHPDALAAAMARLAQEPAARVRMGAAGRFCAQARFSLEHMRAKIMALYDELTGRRAAQPVAAVVSSPTGDVLRPPSMAAMNDKVHQPDPIADSVPQ